MLELSLTKKKPSKELTLDLGDGVTMEFIYVKPGTFVMGGENEKAVASNAWKYRAT